MADNMNRNRGGGPNMGVVLGAVAALLVLIGIFVFVDFGDAPEVGTVDTPETVEPMPTEPSPAQPGATQPPAAMEPAPQDGAPQPQ